MAPALVTANKQIKQGKIDFGMRTARGLLAYVMPLGVPTSTNELPQ
jgi:hypothetical protein